MQYNTYFRNLTHLFDAAQLRLDKHNHETAKQNSKSTLNTLSGTFLVSRVVFILRGLTIRQGLLKVSPSRIYAVRLIVEMTKFFPGNKVAWINSGELTGKDSVEIES
jgi:hypothetical protein